jgi:hypothetical protein
LLQALHAQRSEDRRAAPPRQRRRPPAHRQRPAGGFYVLGADDSGFTLLRQPRSNASAARPPSRYRPAGNASWPSSAKRRATSCGRVSAATAPSPPPRPTGAPCATCRLR